jgi:hypothetical protein
MQMMRIGHPEKKENRHTEKERVKRFESEKRKATGRRAMLGNGVKSEGFATVHNDEL